MLDHPTLAVSPDGVVHTAWIQANITGVEGPQGIFYTRSIDHGETWERPYQIAEAGYDWPRMAISGGQIHILYSSNIGEIEHQWTTSEVQTEAAVGWELPRRVPGQQNAGAPFGLTTDGPLKPLADSQNTLHLLSANQTTGALQYSVWDGERWSNMESYFPRTQTVLESETTSRLLIPAISNAATHPQGATLVVAWLATNFESIEDRLTASPAFFALNRTIPTVDLPEMVISENTPIPTVPPTQTPEATVIPTATPPLNTQPASNDLPISPMALGGGLAAFIVVIIFAGILMRGRKR
jgi:hypothetical protein